MYLKVEEISFDDEEKARSCKNYPKNGFYIMDVKDTRSDFIFVDKSSPKVLFICPKSVLNGIKFLDENPEVKKEGKLITSVTPEAGFVSESFVLELTKLLSNKK